jgi:hypothetical protein
VVVDDIADMLFAHGLPGECKPLEVGASKKCGVVAIVRCHELHRTKKHAARHVRHVSSVASRLELSDPHVSIGKARNDVKLPSHRFDVAAKRADVHVRALLDL